MTSEITRIVDRMKAIDAEYKGKPMPQNVGDEYNRLAEEGASLQKTADEQKARGEQLRKLEAFSREVPDAVLPGQPAARDEQKTAGTGVAGYVSLGELFANSDALRAYKAAGSPLGGHSAPVVADTVVRARDGQMYAVLNGEQRKAYEGTMREAKAVPTLGTGVIDAQRLDLFVQATRPEPITLRSLINVSQTGAPSVEYLYETSYTRAAAPVAASAAKPEAAAAYEVKSATVRTHAVWIPVTEQMLQDAPNVVNLVNNRLLWDLDKLEDEEIVYGSGSGEHFEGITNNSGVVAARTVTGDTLIDKIRRGITDVRKAGYEPNGVAIDPVDWEEIVLLKGTDDRYVWAVVTDRDGSRIWGLPVVETIAMEEVSANTTEERNILVGDWRRGATLWERTAAQIAVGYVNDDFTKNKRTIRAERRAAFATTAPKAFRKIVTQAAIA